MEIVNPIEVSNWDELLLENNQSNFFHTSSWAKVICESYNYEPRYFVEIDNNRLLGLIAVMEINSLLTGKRGVSLPFTDQCQPFADSDEKMKNMLEELLNYGRRKRWRYAEIRDRIPNLDNFPFSKEFLVHTIDISNGENEVYTRFKSSTKRNIKKANKAGIVVKFTRSAKSTESFYHLNAITRRYHGLPPQPKKFFRKIQEHVLAKNYGILGLAYLGEKPVAGGIFFYFNNKAIYKFGASIREYQKFRTNNLVMWEAMRWIIHKGYKQFSFGRTELENTGLSQFKRGWGTIEKKLPYLKYDFKNERFMSEEVSLKSSYKIIRKLPIPISRFVGNLLYRHVG